MEIEDTYQRLILFLEHLMTDAVIGDDGLAMSSQAAI